MLRLPPNVTYPGNARPGACWKATIGIVAATAPIATSTLRWSHPILPLERTKIILRRVSGFGRYAILESQRLVLARIQRSDDIPLRI